MAVALTKFLFAVVAARGVEGGNIEVDWNAGFDDPNARGVEASVGDTITFTWLRTHNVYRMASEEALANCDFTGATDLGAVSPVMFDITALTGLPLYFACEVAGHCTSGQILAVVWEGTSGGIQVNWNAGFTDPNARALEASIGDTIIFNWLRDHNVYRMASQEALANCDFTGATDLGNETPVAFEITALPEYFACEVPNHCTSGQILAVTEPIVTTTTTQAFVDGHAVRVAQVSSVAAALVGAAGLLQSLAA